MWNFNKKIVLVRNQTAEAAAKATLRSTARYEIKSNLDCQQTIKSLCRPIVAFLNSEFDLENGELRIFFQLS